MRESQPLSNTEVLLAVVDHDFREFASRVLEESGFQTIIQTNEQECKDQIIQNSYAVIMLHQSFYSTMDTEDWMRYLRENSGLTEIILIFEPPFEQDSHPEILNLDVFDVLISPVSKRRLHISVKRAAEKHEMSQKWTRLNQDLLSKNLELQESNSMLLEALEESKTFQAYLASSQKLAGIGEMTASVAHEFNNVLGAIRGYSQLAIRRPGSADELFDLHKKIKKAVDRAVDVVGTLLECSSRVNPQQEEADINLAIQETVELSKQHLSLKGIQVHCSFGEIPKFAFDVGQLQQVFLNLITNAGHAIGKGGLIRITTLLEKNQVNLVFEDSGKGIPQENLEKIFIPFFTTKSRTNDPSQEKGSGLGLHVSRQIIESHNGNMRVESVVGKGTTFCLVLPLRAGRNLETPEVQEKALVEEEPNFHKAQYHAKALVVDDEADIRGILRKFLEDKGIEVFEAADGAECIEMARKIPVDLIFLDVMMPNVNGFEAQVEVYKILPEAKVFMISGYTTRREEGEGIPEGVLHFLTKPFDLDELDELVQEALKA